MLPYPLKAAWLGLVLLTPAKLCRAPETPPDLSFFLFPGLLVPLELGRLEKENWEAKDVLVLPLEWPPTYYLYSSLKREAISTISGTVWHQ